MTRQFIECRFRANDGRAYCYHNDGEHVACGDFVQVEAPSGRQSRVEVIAILDRPPPFATKPITGKAPPPEPIPA